MKYKAKSMMSLNEMAGLAIEYEGDGYVTGYPITSGDDAYILNGVIEANEEYIAINQWVPVFPESLKPVSPSLTDGQQVVLKWLKKKIDSYLSVSYLIGNLDYFAATPVGQAWKRLSNAEQFQVLAAFAECGLKEDNQ
ncbi:hypothetical protein [Enterococcus asini]|uniref:hypothetical protein n=1 Tax=Enterococcus asini TaxID=57732 RepID=UPI001E52B7B0|nr:hypothetical protein [Enterococcus asini]MCD5029092.1 hypothetical protein [Enterococcus asini]